MDVQRVGGKFEPVEGSEREVAADLVFLAMGFLGPQKEGLLESLGVEYDERGNVAPRRVVRDHGAGRVRRRRRGPGQSLIVWAIAEGRSAAAGVDAYLTGRDVLPRPINPGDRAFA